MEALRALWERHSTSLGITGGSFAALQAWCEPIKDVAGTVGAVCGAILSAWALWDFCARKLRERRKAR